MNNILNDKLPTLAKEIKNSVTEKLDNNVDLFANKITVDERLSICNTCKCYVNGICKLCGCFMVLKVKINTSKCPAKKW